MFLETELAGCWNITDVNFILIVDHYKIVIFLKKQVVHSEKQ